MLPEDTMNKPARIPLTQGKHALVDQEDVEFISQYKWQAYRNYGGLFYAARAEMKDGKQKTIYMHREILNVPKELHVHHRDCDGLNNQRSNLLPCTRSQNMANSRQKTGASGFRGVFWEVSECRWRSQVRVEGKRRYTPGRYMTPEAAARAYDQLAKEIYGEFARLNFPDE